MSSLAGGMSRCRMHDNLTSVNRASYKVNLNASDFLWFSISTLTWSGNTNLDEFDELNMSCVSNVLLAHLGSLAARSAFRVLANKRAASAAKRRLRDTARRLGPAANRSFASTLRRQPIACICFLMFPSLTHMSHIVFEWFAGHFKALLHQPKGLELPTRSTPRARNLTRTERKLQGDQRWELGSFEALRDYFKHDCDRCFMPYTAGERMLLWHSGRMVAVGRVACRYFRVPTKPSLRHASWDHHGHMVTSHGR